MLWCCRDWIFQSIVSTCPCAFPAPLVQPARLCGTRWLYIKTSSPSCFSLSSLPALRCYSPKTHRHCDMSGSAAVFQKILAPSRWLRCLLSSKGYQYQKGPCSVCRRMRGRTLYSFACRPNKWHDCFMWRWAAGRCAHFKRLVKMWMGASWICSQNCGV
jgi:hypothetical protein